MLVSSRRGAGGLLGRAALAALLALSLVSCAYYNTYYLARKYYLKGTAGDPYLFEKPQQPDLTNFNKSVEYSKKVIGIHPKSKWVDDAYLLWARALLAKDDPREAVRMLGEFDTRYPNSPIKAEARFYLGVAYRQARRYREADRTLAEFVEQSPKDDLAPYALLERARALMSLERPLEAAQVAGQVLERYAKSPLARAAQIARADARLAAKQFDLARADYKDLGNRAKTDEERLDYLLREVDCLEAGRKHDEALALLRDALAHERAPATPDTAQSRFVSIPQTPGWDRYGRLMIRLGNVHLAREDQAQALTAYQRVVTLYPRTPLAAEAQYRLGYAYEVEGDDFDKARNEYTRVRDHGGQSLFTTQAQQRLTNLERIEKFRSTVGDSVERRFETGLMLAELYLFQLEKPDRALEEYRKIILEFPGTPMAAKAMTAEAWVLSRRFDQKAAADSVFWRVVREFPATEAQLAARDYLEMEGHEVPTELIKLPERQLAAADSIALTTPPAETPSLGGMAGGDTLSRGLPPGVISPLFGPGLQRPGAMAQGQRGGPPTQSGSPRISGEDPTARTAPRATAAPDSARTPRAPGLAPPTPRATTRPDSTRKEP